MKKTEAKFQTIFSSWLRNVYKKTGAYELKQTSEDSIPYSRLEEHQEQWLLTAKNKTAVYKISDESIGYKPFDCFCLHNTHSYVVILFQKSKKFYLIDIGNFIFYRDNRAKRKSLTEKEANEIATLSVKI